MIWKEIKKEKPIAYKSGDWDGLKSDKILVATMSDKYHIVEMYEGIMDGSEFCDFYDDRDFEVKNVLYWIEIDSPF